MKAIKQGAVAILPAAQVNADLPQLNPTKEAIKAVRERAKLTQEGAARLCGVTLRTFQRWEYGTVPIKPSAWRDFQEQAGKL